MFCVYATPVALKNLCSAGFSGVAACFRHVFPKHKECSDFNDGKHRQTVLSAATVCDGQVCVPVSTNRSLTGHITGCH